MKLIFRHLQTAAVLLACFWRTCVSLERPGANQAFLSPSANRLEPAASANENEVLLDAAGTADPSDDASAAQEVLDKSQVAPQKDAEVQEELLDTGARSDSEPQPLRDVEDQELHDMSGHDSETQVPLREVEGQEQLHEAGGHGEPDLQPPKDVEGQEQLREANVRASAELQTSPDNQQAAASMLPLAAMQQRSSSLQARKRFDINERPSAKDKKPDVVTFGLFAKQFYDTDLKKNTYSVDNVMALTWKDDRVSDIVPEGLENITLSEKVAVKKVWMPAVRITNREIRQYELISTAVTIRKNGQVTKVERSLVRAKSFFNLMNYPWDKQQLDLKIASTKYMADELVLKPSEDASLSGFEEGLFDDKGYLLEKFETFEEEDVAGGLTKSRGVMRMTVKRETRAYEQSHLIPTFIYLAISWGVFWFPFVVQFITPRLALSILALLTFTNLCIATSKNLPVSAPFNWNDNFNQQVQALMFTTIIFNIYTEIAFHQLKCEEVARAMNHECKIVMPFVSVVSLSMILGNAISENGMSLETTSILVKTAFGFLVFIYIVVCAKRLHDSSVKHVASVTKSIVDTHLGFAK